MLLAAALASGSFGCVTRHAISPEARASRKVAITTEEQPAQAVTLGGYGFVDGQLIVRFKGQAAQRAAQLAGGEPGRIRFGDATLDRLCSKYHVSGLQLFHGVDSDAPERYLLLLAPDANVLRAAEEFTSSPLVEGANPNYRLRIPR